MASEIEEKKFKDILREEVIEWPTDSLAHALNIPYELAHWIKMILARADQTGLEEAEETFRKRI